jgi:hypothetical protein
MVKASGHDVPSSVATFAQRLSQRVRAALPRWEWTWHPERRSSHEELQRDLAKNGIPEWPFLWPLEEAFGGVEVRLAGWDLSFGVFPDAPALKQANLLDQHGQSRFVALGDWGNDILVGDQEGRVYVLEESGVLTPSDSSFESFLEHHAMSMSFIDWCPTAFTLHVVPTNVAALLAEIRSVPPVIEASNEFHRWWRNDSLTLFEWGALGEQDPRGAIWSKTLTDLVEAIDHAARLCPTMELQPIPSYDDAHKEILSIEEVRARAPGVESLRARAGARRFPLIGRPSKFPGKPPSTGDVWISGEGDTLRIDVLEQREGDVVNYWEVTPTGSHALLMSYYGKG